MKNLKTLRNQKRLSQQALADILHISQQSVYKYENDLTFPDIDTLKNIADYFETSIDYIVDYTDIPHRIEPTIELALTRDEADIIHKYRLLLPKYRSIIHTVADGYLDYESNK
ncbi:MAG: helix-turn-helix transcriptional regulator [Lachnospiraceae bacterium]|nr:helix-turn-helix transcriptional regulator [Lachnospiraceae bacterium]